MVGFNRLIRTEKPRFENNNKTASQMESGHGHKEILKKKKEKRPN